MTMKEHDKNLLWQFNKKYNETIEMFFKKMHHQCTLANVNRL
jgi:hypothetical protein